MDSLQSVVAAVAKGENADRQRAALNAAVIKGDVTLDQLVQAIEKGLTTADLHQRDPLCNVLLTAVTPLEAQLTVEERLQLTHFLINRLQDWSCLLSGLQGCLFMVSSPSLEDPANSECLVAVAHAFVDSLDVQSLKQSHRWTALQLLHALLERYGKELRQQKADVNWLEIGIRSIDGEKDPRCLLIAFKLIQPLIALYKDTPLLTESAEELFDVVSCYFPITDTEDFEMEGEVKVTYTELTEGLHHAMTCTAEFGEYCLPLLLEKLTSDHKSPLALVEAEMKCCVETFSVELMMGYFRALWNEMKGMIFIEQDLELQSIALQTTQRLCQLTPSTGVDGEMLYDLVFMDEHLLDLIAGIKNHSYAMLTENSPVIALLTAVAWIGSKTAIKVVDCVLTPLLRDFTSHIQISKSKGRGGISHQYITVFHHLMHKLCVELHQERGTLIYPESLTESLTAFLGDLKTTLDRAQSSVEALEGHSGIEAAQKGELPGWEIPEELIWLLKLELLYLSIDFQFLTQADWRALLKNVLTHVTGKVFSSSEGHHEPVLELISALVKDTVSGVELLRLRHQVLVDFSLSCLVPDVRDAPSSNEVLQRGFQFRFLDTLMRDSVYAREQLCQFVQTQLLHWLIHSLEAAEKQMFLAELLRFLRRSVLPAVEPCVTACVPELLQLLISFAIDPNTLQESGMALESCLVEELRTILCVLTQRLPPPEQQKVYQRVHGDECGSVELIWKFAIFCGISDFQTVLPNASAVTEFYMRCVAVMVDRLEDFKHEMHLYQSMAAAAFHLYHSLSSSLAEICLQHIESVVKDTSMVDRDDVTGLVLMICVSLKGLLSNSFIPHSICERAVESLLLPLSTLLHHIWKSRQEWAQGSELAMCGIEFLVSDDTSHHTGVYKHLLQGLVWESSLQRQRGFSLCLSQLISKLELKTGSEGTLLALGCLLRGAGDRFVKMEGRRVLPWLLHLIELLQAHLKFQSLLISSLEQLDTLLHTSMEAVRALKREIMRSVMHCVEYRASSEIRIRAMRCLGTMLRSILSTDDLQLYQLQVSTMMRTALDDPKRRARRCAVQIRLILDRLT